MTTYEVKERLREYRRACRRCGELEQRIARKRSDMRALRAVRTDSQPGGSGNSLEAAIEKIDGLERRLVSEQTGRDAALADVRALIGKVTDEEGRAILSLRCIDGVRFEDIPGRLFISYATMWRRYEKAITQIADSGIIEKIVEQ